MRNKGFFWFLTILLTAVCLYQLSFTWVSTNVENKSIKEANERVLALKKEAASTNNIGVLPNNTSVDFSKPESMELAKAAFINQILKEKAENKVYPIFGSTFSVKKILNGLLSNKATSPLFFVQITDLLKKALRSRFFNTQRVTQKCGRI